MNWCDPKDWEKEFPKGTPIRCEYKGSYVDKWPFQFDAHSTGIFHQNRLLVKVVRGTGHKREHGLHRGERYDENSINIIAESSDDYWWLFDNPRSQCKIAHLETTYDPNQNRDTDEDI